MQVPGRSAVLVAVLALVSLLLAGCGGGSEGSGSSAADTGTTTSSSTTPTTSPSTSPEDPWRPRSTTRWRASTAAPRSPSCSSSGCASTTWTPATPSSTTAWAGCSWPAARRPPVEDIAAVTGRWQAAVPGPGVWVAVDQEGGAVQTLKGSGFDRLPSAREQGALPADQLSALAEGLGASLAAAGVNLDLAPVVDVVPPGTEAGNAPIGAYGREYGGTPEAVTAAAGTIVGGLSDAGVTATLKHFPGLGRVTGNTDDTAVVHDTVTTADDPQLTVFSTLADSPAAPFVMASSAIYDRIDGSEQAMFSPVVLTDVLRGQLGFDGVVISDDVGNADAVAGVAVGDRAVRFLGAGGTLVLTVEATQFEPMVDAVLARAEDDAAFAEVVDAAVRTALLAKARAGLLG